MADDWKIRFKAAFKLRAQEEQAAATALAEAQKRSAALAEKARQAKLDEQNAKGKLGLETRKKKPDAERVSELTQAHTKAQTTTKDAATAVDANAATIASEAARIEAARASKQELELLYRRAEYAQSLKLLHRRLREGEQIANAAAETKAAFAEARKPLDAKFLALEDAHGRDDFAALKTGVADAKTLLKALLTEHAPAVMEAERAAIARSPAVDDRIAPLIEWAPPAPQPYVSGGVALGAAQLNATIAPIGPALVYTPAAGTTLAAGTHKLKVASAERDGFEIASAEVDFVVAKASRTITWAAPAAVVYAPGGFELTATQLGATCAPAGTLVYDPPLGSKLAAGTHALKVSVVADDNHEAAETTVRLVVAKARPEITWAEPASALKAGTPPKFKLSATQLNAVRTAGESALVYAPAVDAELGVGTTLLTVRHAESANYEYAEKSVRMTVNASASEKAGYDALRGGGGFSGSVDADVQDKWDKDTGKVKSQAQELMSAMQDMTGPELVAYMNGKTKSADRKSQGGDYPNELWKLPNGLQIRYKSKGDRFTNPDGSTPTPMFCIEVRDPSCAGFSAGQDDIACKISVDGGLAPKGPGDTDIEGDTATKQAAFKTGSVAATHLQCRQAKLDQQIVCRDAIDVPHGTPLTAALFEARLQPGGGALTVTPTTLAVGDAQAVTLKAAATDRFNEATKIVRASVKKAKPQIKWAEPKPVKALAGGFALGATQLNAKIEPEAAGPLVYAPASGERRAAGDHALKVSTAGNAAHEAAEATVTLRVEKIRARVDWTPPEPCAADIDGVVLTAAQLNAMVEPAEAEFSYDPPLDTRLPIGVHPLTLRIKGSETIEAATITRSFKVRLETL